MNLRLLGLGFRDTHTTNMDPHAVPSAGDWALPRSAAVFLQGVVDSTIDGCVFERLDGNAIMLSAFNRNVTISRNEFAWIGASAVVVWGNAEGGGSPSNDSIVPSGYGFNGTNGDQPRTCTITQNFCRENGVIVKQSSFFTSFKGSVNTVSRNIVFNGPRAHININDGFRGGNMIERNLLVNGIRETGDHGPINSWNRESYLFDGQDGKPTVYKMMDTVRQNLILGNYGTLASVDTDDGTCYWSVEKNFMLYGSVGMKGWQQGHDVSYSGNVQILAHGGPGDDMWAQAAGSGYGSGLNSAMLGHGYNYTDNFVVIPAFVNPSGCCHRDWIGTEGFCWANQSSADNGLARVANNTVYYGDRNITEWSFACRVFGNTRCD